MALNLDDHLNTTTTAQASSEKRAPAKLWLNVGFTNADGKFISLPIGIPVDQLKLNTRTSRDEGWQTAYDQENALVKLLQEKGMALDQGQELPINGFEIRLRRVVEKDEAAANERIHAIKLPISFG